MEDISAILLIVFIITCSVAIIVILGEIYARKQDQERQEKMKPIACQLGLNYLGSESISFFCVRSTPNNRDRINKIYQEINLFKRGSGSMAYNIISGNKNGYLVELFDYVYATGSGKSQKIHENSVCIITIPQHFNHLLIRSEGFLDKTAITSNDIDFESKEFSSRYYVESNDKKFAYDIIHPQMMEFLLSGKRVPSIETGGKYLCCYFEDKINPVEYIALYNFTGEFYNKIPNYVMKEYKQRD